MKRVLSLVALIAIVTGCSSGGGSGSSSVPAQTPAGTAPQSVGTTTLTIKFPASFGHVTPASIKGARPQFVNPTNTNFLDVYVDQHLVILPGGPSGDTANINNTNPDGTQTLSIPQYSTGVNDVLVVERDPSNHVLALGQSFANIIFGNPGTSNSASINMAMNLASFAYSTNGTTASALANNTTVCVGNSPGSTPIQFVGVDPSGGFTLTSPAGVGGLATLTVSPSAIAPTITPPSNIASTLGGSFSLIYDSAHTGLTDGVSVFIAAGNPANLVYQGLQASDQAIVSIYAAPSPASINQTLSGVSFYPLNNLSACG